MIQDLKYAFRHLLRTKGWTSVVLVSLMLGIGANTALFSAVNGMLIQTLAVSDPAAARAPPIAGKNDMERSGASTASARRTRDRTCAPRSRAGVRGAKQANKTLTDLFAAAPLGALECRHQRRSGHRLVIRCHGGASFSVLGLERRDRPHPD